MEDNIITFATRIESGESPDVEQESLNDATSEPRSHIEQTGDYEQSEGVQAVFEIVVEQHDSKPGNTQAEKISDGKSGKTFKDPLTGKGYGGDKESSSESSTDDEEPVVAEQSETVMDVMPQTKAVTSSQEESETGMSSPNVIDGNEPVYQMDEQDTNFSKNVGTGVELPSEVSKDFEQQRLGPENLPEKGRIPIGMGTNGALFPGGGKMPRGKGPGMGGSSTSGGGPPVGGPGGVGSKGKGGKTKYWGTVDGNHYEGSSNDSCEKETVKQSKMSEISTDGNVVVDCGDGTQYQITWENGGPVEVTKRGMTMDGDQPMPYTGNWGGGEDPDPDKPIGGLDRESAKVFPVYGKGGGSDSGSKTPGDKDGEDDSGKFLGDPNLTGGGPDFGDPDFPDYYTPNVLEEIEKKQKTSK